jgi:hypothetical protein
MHIENTYEGLITRLDLNEARIDLYRMKGRYNQDCCEIAGSERC